MSEVRARDVDRTGIWEGWGIVVDSTHWPVLIERMPMHFPNDDAAIDAWIAHVESLMASKASRFVMVVDSLATKTTASAHSRRRMAHWLSESAAYQSNCLGAIFLVGSPLTRGALTAINWITRPKPARSTVGSWDEAIAEASVLLGREGLALPAGVESLASRTA